MSKPPKRPPQDDLFSQPPEPTEEAKAIARLRHEIEAETERLTEDLEVAMPYLVDRRAAWDALKAAFHDPDITPKARRPFYDSKDLASRAARPWATKLKETEAQIRRLEKDLDELLGPPPGKRRGKKRPSLLPPEIEDPAPTLT